MKIVLSGQHRIKVLTCKNASGDLQIQDLKISPLFQRSINYHYDL
jgi:hypothetical protein